MPVDGLCADLQAPVPALPARDLLGTPSASEQRLYPVQLPLAVLGLAPAALAPGGGVAVRFVRPVVTVVGGLVALHLAVDRAAVSPQPERHLRHR